MAIDKPWGGRFTQRPQREVEIFTSSLSFDRRLYRQDILGSKAYAKMLCRVGLIDKNEMKIILSGLDSILEDIEVGKFNFDPGDEDIHMAVEKALIARIGEVGKKLHTGRSRNDQVALDLRLFVREEIDEIIVTLKDLRRTLIQLAKRELNTVMPGYTHLQRAQPVLFSHYLMAYDCMFARDLERLENCRERTNVLPLGSGAIAGSNLPLDRRYLAKILKFPEITKNSMDAVADRDFVVEFVFSCALIMMHLSRLCEDLIVWSTDEFKFVEFSDDYSTGSSMMPQKKNPDVAELIRGKTGRVYGNLVSLLVTLKGLPMTYNRDLQEDKEPLFDTVDTVKSSIKNAKGMLNGMKINRERMKEAAYGFTIATDIAEYLVMKGVPFRDAHRIVGEIVAYCLEKRKSLSELDLKEFKEFHNCFDEDALKNLSPDDSVRRKVTEGSTSPEEVRIYIEEQERKLFS
ncbi:MAG: argininosuccinate lyase [Syntrophales bacterium]|nr:argininosuccinate lyase [Syntrophales bacterium]